MVKQPRRATVWWGDAWSSGEHIDEDNPPPHMPMTIGSTGWLFKQDKAGILLCTEWNGETAGKGFDPYWGRKHHFIPRGMIQRVEWLEVKA